MAVKILNDYYVKHKSKLMKDFSKRIKIARDMLKKKFNEAKINDLCDQMKIEYEKIIPEIPYIGGTKNPFSTLLVGGLADLAMFRVLEKEGFALREIGEFYYEFRDINNTIRKNSLEKIGKDPANYPFEASYVEWAKKQCELSNSKKYAYDWVEDFVEGDEKTFEWGFNFHECGIHKACKKLDAERFVPFFCLADFSEANILGFGFFRTQTLGFGASMCDHRYVKNYKTPRGWPPDDLPEFNKDKIP
ncbi:MAG: L-2-amino-thiazoline-4-carboxylic acid hydrolase [Promethearchaeota archaeon]